MIKRTSLCVALLAAHYDLDVESELASILPQLPEEAD